MDFYFGRVISCCNLADHDETNWMAKYLKFFSRLAISSASKKWCSTTRQWVFCDKLKVMRKIFPSIVCLWWWLKHFHCRISFISLMPLVGWGGRSV